MTRPPPSSLRIVSYNVHKAVGSDYRRRPTRIIRVLASLRADIAVLQEVDHRLGRRPATLSAGALARATGLEALPIADNGVSLGWCGCAMLARGPIAAEAVHRIALPGLEPRGALIVDLATPIGAIRVVGVHLGLLRASRRSQIDAIRAALDDMAPRPTVIAGDFNEWSRAVGLGRLAPAFTVHTPGRTFPARRPLAALDRFATGAGASLAASGVLRNRAAALASDHLPIWGDLVLSGGPR